jgi:hypothetical protein
MASERRATEGEANTGDRGGQRRRENA